MTGSRCETQHNKINKYEVYFILKEIKLGLRPNVGNEEIIWKPQSPTLSL